MKTFPRRHRRAGAILVLAAFMMVLMFAFLAFAVDIGYLTLVRTQSQASADSAAMASTWELLNSHFDTPSPTAAATQTQALDTARTYAKGNYVGGTPPDLADSDITIGRIDLSNGRFTAGGNYPDQNRLNAVQVRVRRTGDPNPEVPLFFARALGVNTAKSQAVAMAAYCDNFQGFRQPPAGGANLQILPIALDKPTWDAMMTQTNRTAKLYPKETGSPGNCGTVDIGDSGNSTADLSRQIRNGITAHDLSHLQNGLMPGPDGTIQLNGDTGVSAGIKDDLQSIIGKGRIIPLFSTVTGNGNNATYTVVRFVGVRILAVNMTGKLADRYVQIEPANMVIENGIPGSDDNQFSEFLYSKSVWLVR